MPTSYDIAEGLISRLGGNPNNRPLVRAVAIWMRFETGTRITGNNPWNIRGRGPCGGHYFGSNGPFKTYCSLDQGLDDTARLLSISQHGYPKIKAAVRAGDPRGFLVAVYTSKWCHSATQTFCYNNGKSLLSALTGSFSYLYTPSFVGGNPGPVTGGGGGGGVPVSTGNIEDAFETIKVKEWVIGVLGPSAQPDHVLTQFDVDKLYDDVRHRFDALGDFPGKDAALAGVSTGLGVLVGHKVSELSGTIKLPKPPKEGINPFGALDTIGQAFAFVLDVENWYYMLMFGAGVVITAWSVRNLFGAELGVRPRLAEAVTEVKQVKPGVTQSKTKTRER